MILLAFGQTPRLDIYYLRSITEEYVRAAASRSDISWEGTLTNIRSGIELPLASPTQCRSLHYSSFASLACPLFEQFP